MALDTTEEFFIGDYVYLIARDGSVIGNGQVMRKDDKSDPKQPWYEILVNGYHYTETANFLSYTL